MNKNKLSSLSNLSRKETDFCSKIWKCLFWLERSWFFLVKEIKKLLFREQTLCLLLFLIPQFAVPKKLQPLSQWPTAYSLRKVYCGGEVSLHTSAPLHPSVMISARGIQAPKAQGHFWAKWWNMEWHFKAKWTVILCSINKWCIRKYRKVLSSKLFSWQQLTCIGLNVLLLLLFLSVIFKANPRNACIWTNWWSEKQWSKKSSFLESIQVKQ